MADNPEMTGVELPALEFLQKMGWEYRKGSAVTVANRTLAPILRDKFSEALKTLNPWIDESGIDKALDEIRKVNEEDLMHTNRLFWREFVQTSSFQLPCTENGHTRLKTVQFFGHDGGNNFTVVNQYVGKSSGGDQFKPDILLFVNGIPVGIIECKASHIKLEKGISQVIGYQKAYPKQFNFNQVCASINRNEAKYGAIRTPAQYWFSYRLEEAEENEVKQLAGDEPNEQQRVLWALFEPSRLIDLLFNQVLFEQTKDGLVKKLPRYQQWRAVRKCVERLHENDGGVVWHTQGSGKSLTMATLARQLRSQAEGFGNPSVLILTDRKDLDKQIFDTFVAVGMAPEKALSVAGLQARLTNDYGGVFTSTIQKFQTDTKGTSIEGDDEENDSLTRVQRIERDGRWYMVHSQRTDTASPWAVEKEDEIDFQVLSTKENFFVLVDEAHRSHYGFLGAFMRAALPNAKMIAFTGTPLLKEEKNTLQVFDAGRFSEYIDKYTLIEAVRDGFTLPIRYLDGIATLTVDGLIDSDFDVYTRHESEAKRAVLRQKLLKERRHTRSRYRHVAEHLVANFEEGVFKNGCKAMLVCEGRPSAVQYKEILDEIMAERAKAGKQVFESRVIISLGSITDNRSADEEDAEAVFSIEERVRKAVREGKAPIAVPSDAIPDLVHNQFKLPFGDESENDPKEPKYNNIAILIVSDMLLTGYDAPIVSTLYLDKPLREHTLLQAIARVNRTRNGKNAGYIVDYYGIVPHLDEALKVYGGDVKPADIMEGPTAEIPKLEAACSQILSILPKKHKLEEEPEKFKEDAEKFLDPETRRDVVDDFLEAVAKFNKLLSIVLPHPAGAPFKPYFVVFSQLRMYVRNLLILPADREIITAEESAFLKQFAEDHITGNPVYSLLNQSVDIFDQEEFEKLKKLSAGTAALVMKNQLKATITAGLPKQPGFFGSLQEELNRLILEEQEERVEQISFLQQMEGFLNRIRDKDNEAITSGFTTPEAIAVFNYLKEKTDTANEVTRLIFDNEELQRTISSPNWSRNPSVLEEVKRLLRRHLKGVSGWDATAAKQHAEQLVDRLKDAS